MNKIGAKGGNAWVWVVIAAVAIYFIAGGNLDFLHGNNNNDNDDNTGGTYYAPDASYLTQNAFGTESVSGTAYYVENGGLASSTAPKLTKNQDYTYWMNNGSSTAKYVVKPTTFKASEANNIINKVAYQNGSVTITGYDVVNHCTLDGLTCNATLGANQQAKIDVTYLGGAKTANLPFGGVMVVEYNATVPTVSASGDGIVGPNSNYQVTYSDAATTNTHAVYEVAEGFDISKNNGATGVTNVIRLELTNGATAVVAGSSWKVTFIPANYYLGNDGKIYKDVEQKMNGATTRTAPTNGMLTQTFYTE